MARPTWRTVPHHHEELEVNLITSGRASYLFAYAMLASWQAFQSSQESILFSDVHPAVQRRHG
jgi:hypothetical protein